MHVVFIVAIILSISIDVVTPMSIWKSPNLVLKKSTILETKKSPTSNIKRSTPLLREKWETNNSVRVQRGVGQPGPKCGKPEYIEKVMSVFIENKAKKIILRTKVIPCDSINIQNA